ncbi:Benzoyl-CoA reductase/2-hydroxyglutaryl-CoA dehydratase subunit, BcrC/BadD/HgdB [Lentzea fradiae]|uniref:Benzoyl-CoA reductase/2-hydroxyglutaryl-CoA dehydratase subunit, BcrC/BadD/HgdB n=1 Tax=Lentzea fradiae TaxID=200378 RepID=A0A1G7LB13_9PSEU|nr:2-hydroxyacyl-CoA dehydratase family protein [Lentzea fradiae]SDF46566.1 Benzoyl-CoA reductase/2-hydroxyglutaryl-CoA dehydratase subunit, BcrC/BadD/HgdB [Lentzea fradiae]
MRSPLRRLVDHYERRYPVDVDGPVIGCVGQDVPVELVTAAGALPVRLAGRPGLDVAEGEKYLGRGVDPATLSVLTRLLNGEYGRLDRLLVSRDCEGSLRLFYAVRELRRLEPGLGLPETHLVDVLHLPHWTTARYNQVRFAELVAVLERWTGTRLTAPKIASAIMLHDARRDLWRAVSALRRDLRLTGAQALAAFGAVLPVAEHNRLLRELLKSDLDVHRGRRVFFTGSSHDNPNVYWLLEEMGSVVVGEDHDWGDLLATRLVGEPTLAALVERYQYNGPTAARASIAARAAHTAQAAAESGAELVVSYVRRNDDAPPWDFPAQREALRPHGIPAVLFDRQEYGLIDLSEVFVG